MGKQSRKVIFEFDARGWQITQNAVALFKQLQPDDQQFFLHQCTTELQSEVTEVVKRGMLKPKTSHLVVKDKLELMEAEIAIACAMMIVSAGYNEPTVVRLELHMMLSEEYRKSEEFAENASD